MTTRDRKRAKQKSLNTLLAGGLMASLASHLAPAAYAQTISDRFLSRVSAQEEGACATVNIEFNAPVRYTSHFPDHGGRELRIGVQPLNFNRGSLSTGFATESLRPPSSAVAGIQRITYDVSDPAGPTLVLQFDHDANWDVKAGQSATSIVVTISGREGCVPDGGAAAAAAGSNIILAVTPSVPDRLEASGNYSINLLSVRGKEIPAGEIKQVDAFKQFAGYAYTAEENGTEWTRLRLGTFATRSDAETTLQGVVTEYPDAWIARIDRIERDRVYQAWLAARSGAGAAPSALPVNAEAEAQLKQLRDAITAGDNALAIRLAEQLLGQPESAATPEAQEMLGLARERNNQLAHAKAEYEIFLTRYPDHANASRVRARLASLLGEEAPETVKPGVDDPQRPQTVQTTSGVKAELSGSISMLYQRDESGFLFEDEPVVGGPEVNPDPIEENRTNLNEILYGADVNLTVGNDRVEGLFRFSGVFRDDFRAGLQRDEGAISTLYLDVSDNEWNAAMRIGRQTRNTGGIFGRFDGGLLSFQPLDNLKLNVAAGFPVQSSRDLEVDTERQFVAGSLDFSLFPDMLDTTIYYVDQKNGGLVDRQAAGGEFRFFTPQFTAYGVYDYDVHYKQTNLALLNTSVRFSDYTSLSVAVDYRRSPMLTTLNAIFGQIGVEDPNDLLTTYSEEEIYQLALDRSAHARSASVSFSQQLTETLQFNVDVIASNVSGTKASGGVEAQPSTGTEYYYSGQLVASDVFTPGAIVIAGYRYADLQMIEQHTGTFNVRYPITRDLRLNTKLRLDQRDRIDGSSSELSARGSMALSYTMGRSTFFDVEIGGQFSDGSTSLMNTQERGIFGTIGIRQDF